MIRNLNRGASITYLGHSTVLIVTPNGKRILIDPWTTHNPACPPEWRQTDRLGKLDLVLLTHIHNDHAGDAVEILEANPQAGIVCVPEVCTWLGSKGFRNFHPMNIGGSQPLHGIRVSMTQAIHTSSFTEQDGTLVHGGAPVGFILQLENGFTIYAAGDTTVFGDMALLKEIYHPELALIPIGDHYTMGPAMAALALKLLGVRYAIPIHYATFPVLTGTPEELRQHTSELRELQVITLRPGETLD